MKRPVLAPLALAAAAMAAAQWMRVPGWLTAAGVGLAAVAAALALRGTPRGVAVRFAAGTGTLASLALTLLLASATRALARIERDWPSERERELALAQRWLGGRLDQAVQLARGLADDAAGAAGRPTAEAFDALDGLAKRRGPAHGVVLFDAEGRPRAWAGVQRTSLRPDGPDLSVVTTPFYLWLVARRQTPQGVAVSAVLLARADEVPSAGTALTDEFAARSGVGLRFLDARSAPPGSDIFDYVQPGTHGDTLFAVQAVPMAPSAARERALGEARSRAALLVLLILAAAVVLAARSTPAVTVAVAASALASLARAPLAATFGPESVFWPDTYSQGLLGPFSASAGTLIGASIVVFAAARMLWRRDQRPNLLIRSVAVIGAVGAPYLLQTLARGISVPDSGASTVQWLTWQVAIVLAASSLVLVAAALLRGGDRPRRAGPWPWVAAGLALAVALAGLWLWRPGEAWPDWYAYLWVPALLIAIRPMRFRTTLATIAVVAGSSGALLTWRAATEGRMALAEADLNGLGAQAEPLAAQLLDRMVREMPVDTAPRTAGDLYALWRTSALGALGYPASLAVWSAGGRRPSLDLAELDLPPDLVASVAGEALAAGTPIVRGVLRVPGLHAVAAIPLGLERALTIAIGPPSRLIAPTRQARLLLGTGGATEPPYEITLAPPVGAPAAAPRVVWVRDGWLLRGERLVLLPGGARHAHAEIDLRGPSALLQRGALVLGLDIALLAALWLMVEIAAGRAGPAIAAWWNVARRSLRLRLSVTLALFFMAPALAFSIWTQGRFEEQFRSTRELLLERTLRDAAALITGDTAAADTVPVNAAFQGASTRVDAELLLARGGVMTGTSAPVLVDLALADVLVPPEVYRRLGLGDEVSLTRWQGAGSTPMLTGYRLLAREGRSGPAILAAPDVASDRSLRRRKADLAVALALGVVAGALAAILLSGVAARALALPLEQLRLAALAIGSGETRALRPEEVPAELETIRGALVQAAADVEAGQRAQRVLAWGEMARQVAHEIKNPLTPIRLGVQHLLRVAKERPAEVPTVLPPTGDRILAEIDRLDAIARAFSRFALPGAPGSPGVPVEAVDLAAVVRDVVHLYRMGELPPRFESEAEEGVRALARRDELVEVLVNLCENARDAGATVVVVRAAAEEGRAVIEVRDDGRGIAPEVLPHVFEPRFSTTTSGSGLGLAIAKRLVESWGGTIGVVPPQGAGTVLRLELRRSDT